MLELKPVIGVGVGDLQIAAIRETQRIMHEAGGDRQVAVQLILEKLQDLGMISQAELRGLVKINGLGFDTARGDTPPQTAYNEVRRLYDEMLAEGQATPTGLALASGAAGSYFTVADVNGQPTVVAKQASDERSWQDTLGTAGALIGSIWGPTGAAIGAAVGSVAGKIVDECTEDEEEPS